MKKSSVYKIAIITIVILITALLIWRLYSNNLSNKDITVSLSPIPLTDNPNLTDYTPPCQNDRIISLWDSIFQESSENIIILNNSYCLAFKTRDSKLYRLEMHTWFYTSSYEESSQLSIYASLLNTTINLENFSNSVYNTNTFEGAFSALGNITEIVARNITSPEVANETSNKVFKKTLSTFELNTQDFPVYLSKIEQNDSSGNSSEEGLVVYNDFSYEGYYYSLRRTIQSACYSNWTEINTSCNPDDTKTTYYLLEDTTSCLNQTAQPQNKTLNCDYNEDGLIGDLSDIRNKSISVKIFVNNTEINDSQIFQDRQLIEIKDNVKRISFYHNFSSPLNIKNITIEKQNSSSSFGYLIVNGISAEKTLVIDRLNLSSNKICIKNKEISTISQISSSCTGSSEYILSCPGTNSSFSCTITNSTITASGLTSSAVREFTQPQTSPPALNNPGAPPCNTNWSCSAWTSCNNNEQTRTCQDANNCNTNLGKPLILQACSTLPTCNPYWVCSNWQKCLNSTKIRTCTDRNNCNLLTNKPNETEQCNSSEISTKTIMTIQIISIILIITIIAAIIFYVTRKKEDNPEFVITNNPRSPPKQ